MEESDLLYNFMYHALVIIYEDGTIDRVPVKLNYRSHLEYFRYLKKVSPTFKEICGNCDFEDFSCRDIRHTLCENGCTLFLNFNIKRVITQTMVDLPGFQVLVPNEFGSEEQVEEIENIINGYSKPYLSFYTYKDNEKVLLSLNEVQEMFDNIDNIRKVA